MFREPDSEPNSTGESTRISEAPDRKKQKQTPVVCRNCGTRITFEEREIRVENLFEHTFANPHGIVFTIGCYDEAPGCGLSGRESSDFSWFEGYSWRVAVCGDCGTHLGWRFWSSDHVFFGLILKRLETG